MSATSAIAPAALWASAINSLTAAAVSRNWIRYCMTWYVQSSERAQLGFDYGRGFYDWPNKNSAREFSDVREAGRLIDEDQRTHSLAPRSNAVPLAAHDRPYFPFERATR